MEKKKTTWWQDLNPFRQSFPGKLQMAEWKFLGRIVAVILVLGLFILALELVKESLSSQAGAFIYEKLQGLVSTSLKAFSMGWLGTCTMLSGSPVAATGIGFFSSGILPQTSLLALILGSRAAPKLILFLAGLVALLKKKSVARALGIGLIEFLTTLTVVAGSTFLSWWLLDSKLVYWLMGRLQGGLEFFDVLQKTIAPLAGLVINFLSPSLAFIGGVGILIVSIFLFDKVFHLAEIGDVSDEVVELSLRARFHLLFYQPKVYLEHVLSFPKRVAAKFSGKSFKEKLGVVFKGVVQNPVGAFFLGLVVTAVTMSSSVSVALLLPFYTYGMINIRSVVPYVLGANISTYADTLILAMVAGNFGAVQVIWAILVGTIIVTIFVGIFFQYYLYVINRVSNFILKHPWSLVGIIGLSILGPLAVVIF